jgi:predicted metal-dependent enzyme (double-stranded beta helix superfamily)
MNEGFEIEHLVAELRQAALAENPRAAVKDVLEAAVADPTRMRAQMPEYEENDVILHEDETVSIWHCRFMPGQTVPPHDHQMLATIGVYSGAERNDFYQAHPDTGGIQKSSEVVLEAGNVLQIGPNAIHSVGCASEEPCLGIHVYLGALTTVDRSLFDVEGGAVLPFTDENYARMTKVNQ